MSWIENKNIKSWKDIEPFLDRNIEQDMFDLADSVLEEMGYDENSNWGLGVDGKRPFGNSIGVERDILDCIGIDLLVFPEESETEIDQDDVEFYARELYFSMVGFIRDKWKKAYNKT